MTETSPDHQPIWETVESPLAKVVLVAFTDNIGDQPGQMDQHSFTETLAEAFEMDANQKKLAQHFTIQKAQNWAARNIIVRRLTEAGDETIDDLAETLVVLAGEGDAPAYASDFKQSTVGIVPRKKVETGLQTLAVAAISDHKS